MLEYTELQNKSLRGQLIEVIIKQTLIDSNYLFENHDNKNNYDDLKNLLQEKLSLNLKFETAVSDAEERKGDISYQIIFSNEKNTKEIVHFTISGSTEFKI